VGKENVNGVNGDAQMNFRGKKKRMKAKKGNDFGCGGGNKIDPSRGCRRGGLKRPPGMKPGGVSICVKPEQTKPQLPKQKKGTETTCVTKKNKKKKQKGRDPGGTGKSTLIVGGKSKKENIGKGGKRRIDFWGGGFLGYRPS